jgi:hypothetical protein
VSSHVIAIDAFVVTARGAVLPDELEPGEDQVLIVRGGALKFADLEEAGQESEAGETWRLLTAVGDIVLAQGSFVMTRDGPLSGQDIAMQIERGKQPRMEVVGPADLPEMASDTRPPREIDRTCVLSLPRRIIQIPRNGVDALVVEQIERRLRNAQLDYRAFRDARWVAFQVDAPSDTDNSTGPWHDGHAEALLDLTAWEPDGESTISRVRFEDSSLRRRILASLAGSRRGFEVKWAPAYRPIECRIHPLDARSMKPFAPVQTAVAETSGVRRLTITDPGHLVLGLAVVAPHAG